MMPADGLDALRGKDAIGSIVRVRSIRWSPPIWSKQSRQIVRCTRAILVERLRPNR